MRENGASLKFFSGGGSANCFGLFQGDVLHPMSCSLLGIYVRSFDLVFGACLPSWENLKIYVKGRVLQRKIHGCTCRCSGNFAGGGKDSCFACLRTSIAPVRANQFPPSPIADRCKKSRKRFERKIIAKATDTGRGCIAPLPLFPSFFERAQILPPTSDQSLRFVSVPLFQPFDPCVAEEEYDRGRTQREEGEVFKEDKM